jgi:hypothetical protein
MLRPGQEEFEALIQTYNPRTGNWLSDTKDILLRFFQDFFHEMPEGEGLFHYEPESGAAGEIKATDEIATELIISSAGAINTDTVEKRPAIVISRGPFGFGDTSIDALKGLDWTDGKETRADLLSGSFTIYCISRIGEEAEKLALIVAKSIRYYRVTLQQAGFFNIGIRVQIGEESPANTLLHGDSDEDFVAVPVSFPVYYEEGWTLEYPNAASLDALKCTLNAVLRDFDGDLLYPDALDESGNPDPDSEGVIVSTWTMTS